MSSQDRIYGYFRDNEIYEAILRHKCLSAEQIRLLFFSSLSPESAKRVCQRRLTKLVERGLVDRWRQDKDEPYLYFEKKLDQKEHIVMTNWMYIWYCMKNKFLSTFHLDYQKNFGIVIPDLFLVTHNKWLTNKAENPYKGVFFEADRTIKNKFDKIPKYIRQFEQKYYDENVVLTAPHFPKIIIATTNLARLKHIQEQIKKDNIHDLQFEVYLINDLKEECLNGKFDSLSISK